MKISNTILAVFQLMNEMSAKAANNFVSNVDYLFTSVEMAQKVSKNKNKAPTEGRLLHEPIF